MDPGKRRSSPSAARILPSPFYRHFLSPLDVVDVLPLNEHFLGLLLHQLDDVAEIAVQDLADLGKDLRASRAEFTLI